MLSPFQKVIASTQRQPGVDIEAIELALEEAMAHVAHHAQGSPVTSINMLLIGGAALHATGFRKDFSDVDLMIENIEISTRMEQKILCCPKSGMNIELFYDNQEYSLVDPLKFKRAIPLKIKTFNRVDVSVGLYPPEFFLLRKLDRGREKCQSDIRNLLMGIPLESLAKAFNDLAEHNEKWLMNDLADMLTTDLIMLHLPGKIYGDALFSLKKFCLELNIEQPKKRELLMTCKYLELGPKKASLKSNGVEFDP